MKKYFKTEMIDKYLKKNNLTIDKFCTLCGISGKEFDRIYSLD